MTRLNSSRVTQNWNEVQNLIQGGTKGQCLEIDSMYKLTIEMAK